MHLQWVKKKKKAIPSIYKIGLQFCRILLGPGGNFENTFILFHPYQSCLLSLPPHWPPWGREPWIFPHPLGAAADFPCPPRQPARGPISLVPKMPLWRDRSISLCRRAGLHPENLAVRSTSTLQRTHRPPRPFFCTRRRNKPKESKDEGLELSWTVLGLF